ncbi:MAG: BREX system ATP-binding domain-containing protein [Syntrophomonas sp.]
MGLAAGLKVFVKQLGKATVIKLTRHGALVSLDDAKGLEVEMPSQDLEVIEEDYNQSEIIKPVQEVKEAMDVNALKSLEALRFGLVPEAHVQMLTLGYERLQKWANACFPENCDDKPRAYEITGPFGTGKSHTMSVIRFLAQAEGYLTARVEVDGEKISLAEPDQLLYTLWLTLTGKDLISDTPLLDLYLMAIKKGHKIVPRGLTKSLLFTINYEFILRLKQLGLVDKYALLIEEALSSNSGITATRIKDEFELENSIRRSEVTLRPVLAKRKMDRPRNFIESLAGHALIAKAAGYKGLVVTIDEFEVQYTMAKGGLRQIEDFISLLTEYLTVKTDLPLAPLAIFFATVGQDGHQGDILIEDLVKRSGGGTFVLSSWTSQQYMELAQKIFSLYKQVYGLENDFDPLLAQEVNDLLVTRGFGDGDVIRMYIKWYMAKLDLKYGPGRQQGEYH